MSPGSANSLVAGLFLFGVRGHSFCLPMPLKTDRSGTALRISMIDRCRADATLAVLTNGLWRLGSVGLSPIQSRIL